MIVDLDTRPSDLPFVHAVYQARSIGGGSFISNATTQWEMVITKQAGKITLSLRGPETKASPAPVPEDAEFLGIIFRHGTFMPRLPSARTPAGCGSRCRAAVPRIPARTAKGSGARISVFAADRSHPWMQFLGREKLKFVHPTPTPGCPTSGSGVHHHPVRS